MSDEERRRVQRKLARDTMQVHMCVCMYDCRNPQRLTRVYVCVSECVCVCVLCVCVCVNTEQGAVSVKTVETPRGRRRLHPSHHRGMVVGLF